MENTGHSADGGEHRARSTSLLIQPSHRQQKHLQLPCQVFLIIGQARRPPQLHKRTRPREFHPYLVPPPLTQKHRKTWSKASRFAFWLSGGRACRPLLYATFRAHASQVEHRICCMEASLPGNHRTLATSSICSRSKHCKRSFGLASAWNHTASLGHSQRSPTVNWHPTPTMATTQLAGQRACPRAR